MRKRKLSKRLIPQRTLILCEGKTEYIYFDGIRTEKLNKNQEVGLRIAIAKPKDVKGVGKEMVEQAKSLKGTAKKENNEYKEIWVVFDKDNYTKHHEAFTQAKGNKINIAFSSVSFEYWFLLH